MPELPEVETVRAGLEPALIGRAITVITPIDFPGVLGGFTAEEASALLVGRSITGVSRRGKYLIVALDDGAGIIAHLRMTGVLTIEPGNAPPPRFHRLTIGLNDARELRFDDQRKFGRVVPATQNDVDALDARLGPEPLSPEFNPTAFFDLLSRRKAPIKALLLDQRIVAGLGNIYVDEALFRSRINPGTPASRLRPDQVEQLHTAIVTVLEAGIRNRGTSFDSFRDIYGSSGENQQHLVVYGRGKHRLPCVVCGAPLQRMIVGGRGTSYCAVCQPEQ